MLKHSMWRFLSLLPLLVSCQSSEHAEISEDSRPELPHAAVETPSDSLLNHPWLCLQPEVRNLDDVIRGDLESMDRVCQVLASRGVDRQAVVERVTALQGSLLGLGLEYPKVWYSVLHLPSASSLPYATPAEFQVYKRVYVDRTDLGMPIFLDLRVFSLSENVAIQDIVAWHKQLLSGNFVSTTRGEWQLIEGKGAYSRVICDPSHGFSTAERGVFCAYRQKGERLYVLFFDAPLSIYELHRKTVQSVIKL